MKHYIIEINYTKPIETISAITPKHREYLKKGYDSGILLYSGRRSDQKGGIVIARAESEETISGFFSRDPYRLNNAAEYRIIEFGPVSYQEWMKNWVEGK